jgi:hypothetical protein
MSITYSTSNLIIDLNQIVFYNIWLRSRKINKSYDDLSKNTLLYCTVSQSNADLKKKKTLFATGLFKITDIRDVTQCTLCVLYRALWYSYVMLTNKMHLLN